MIKVVSTNNPEPWFKANVSKCDALRVLTEILSFREIKYKINGYKVCFDKPITELPDIMKELEETLAEYV